MEAETPVSFPEPDSGNQFDPKRLRLSQNYADAIGVKRARLTIPVRKPHRQWFIRVHPDPEYMMDTLVLELEEDREVYIVTPDIAGELPGEVTAKRLCTAINRQGVLFFWHIRLPGEDGRVDAWNQAALEAADMAKGRWIRLAANMSLGSYDVYEASGDLPDPEWPEESLEELLEIAFKDRLIATGDHPIIRRLLGGG